jgi:hypothetical protein
MRIDITTTLYSPHSASPTPLALSAINAPVITEGDPTRLGDIAAKPSVTAKACIYCGDPREPRTKEHAIPYAWGGTLPIFKGSCKKCQDKTTKFEGAALNQGAMANVRMVRGIQSYSGHQSADDTIDVTFIKEGQPVVETIATKSVPLVLGLPWFPLPGRLAGTDQSQLCLDGWLTAAIGPDVDLILKEHGASGMNACEDRINPVAFARTIAKIAYCYAWIDGVVEFVDGAADLVRAFMDEPDSLGAFVGMKPQPFERFAGLGFRVAYRLDNPRLVYMEVQPFPDTAAPTYLVVLGACRTVRAWRRARTRIAQSIEPVGEQSNG